MAAPHLAPVWGHVSPALPDTAWLCSFEGIGASAVGGGLGTFQTEGDSRGGRGEAGALEGVLLLYPSPHTGHSWGPQKGGRAQVESHLHGAHRSPHPQFLLHSGQPRVSLAPLRVPDMGWALFLGPGTRETPGKGPYGA